MKNMFKNFHIGMQYFSIGIDYILCLFFFYIILETALKWKLEQLIDQKTLCIRLNNGYVAVQKIIFAMKKI